MVTKKTLERRKEVQTKTVNHNKVDELQNTVLEKISNLNIKIDNIDGKINNIENHYSTLINEAKNSINLECAINTVCDKNIDKNINNVVINKIEENEIASAQDTQEIINTDSLAIINI